MNTKLLRRVAKHISEEPRRFDMGYMTTPLDEIPKRRQPPCGTVACIAGWALILSKKAKYNNEEFPVDSNGNQLGAIQAAQLLQIPNWGTNLFYVDDWPRSFRAQYTKARTAKRRADIAVARIEHFIKTKGAE